MKVRNFKPWTMFSGFVLLLALAGVLLVNLDLNQDEPGAAGTGQSTDPGAGANQVAGNADDLGKRYVSCARAAGFDPGDAQVITNDVGTPQWVKTGNEVPAKVHGPCFVKIGGAPTDGTSYGQSPAS